MPDHAQSPRMRSTCDSEIKVKTKFHWITQQTNALASLLQCVTTKQGKKNLVGLIGTSVLDSLDTPGKNEVIIVLTEITCVQGVFWNNLSGLPFQLCFSSWLCVNQCIYAENDHQPTKRVSPIRRSADGKFHPDTSSNSGTSTSERSCAANGTERRQGAKKLRPVSDSFIPREMIRIREPALEERIDEDDEEQALEIDCSGSDIEVRLLQHHPDTSRGSHNPHRHSAASLRLAGDRSFSSSLSDRKLCTNQNQQVPRHVLTSFCETPPLAQMYPQADYVYLRDLGVCDPGTPGRECTSDAGRFSPAIHPMMSMRNPTPANPPRMRYHAHSLLPGGHYRLSPRTSLAEPPPEHLLPPELRRARNRPFSPLTADEVNPDRFQNAHNPNPGLVHQCPGHRMQPHGQHLSICRNNRFEERENSNPHYRLVGSRSAARLVPLDDLGRRGSSLSPPGSGTLAYGRNASRASSLPKFKEHSGSLPSLSPGRFASNRDAAERSDSSKRFASVDELNSAEADTDSEQHFSFTSGSASTVRRVPSKDSILCSLDASPAKRGGLRIIAVFLVICFMYQAIFFGKNIVATHWLHFAESLPDQNVFLTKKGFAFLLADFSA